MKRTARLTKTMRVKLPVELAARMQALAGQEERSFSAQTRFIVKKMLVWLEDPKNEKAFEAYVSNSQAQARRKQFRLLKGSTEKRRTPTSNVTFER